MWFSTSVKASYGHFVFNNLSFDAYVFWLTFSNELLNVDLLKIDMHHACLFHVDILQSQENLFLMMLHVILEEKKICWLQKK